MGQVTAYNMTINQQQQQQRKQNENSSKVKNI